MDTTILFIHSDPRLRVVARMALEDAGFEVYEAADLVPKGVGAALPSPDLVVVPWERLAALRERLALNADSDARPATRVIVLALARDIKSAIGSLESGADDCVSIPFEPEELVTRVQACLRRCATHDAPQQRLVAGPIVLDRLARSLLVASHAVELAPTEFRLMSFFLENQGRAFTREELLRRAWTTSGGASERTVDVHVRRLRRALEPFRCEDMIQTVRKFGYRFSVTRRGAVPSDEIDGSGDGRALQDASVQARRQ
jgi:two-component system, OmpR family, phosphate regulon response regulator PhoB